MKRATLWGMISLCLCLSAGYSVSAKAQTPTPSAGTFESGHELKFVVIVSRHGVRSPTGKPGQLNQYSSQPWPVWSVPPGYLTAHGAQLMTLFGAYDRQQLAAEGLLAASGCADAAHIRIVADSDQRTRETGKALAAGMAPGCAVEVAALPEGTNDPLFHFRSSGEPQGYKDLAAAALLGRIGGNPNGLTEAYRPELESLEAVLRGCSTPVECAKAAAPAAQSLLDIPVSIGPGKSDHLVELHTPLGTASSMTEDLLLEYTEGMDAANVGWGRVDTNKLRELMRLHTASEDVSQHTGIIARAQCSNLLSHLLRSIEQARSGAAVAGALSKPDDRLLILVGHDTNLASIGGALNLNWLIDGRRDDTPPGGALVFELWKKRGAEDYSVRTFYAAQTLDQMRNATPLSLANPAERVPVFVPGCGQADGSCRWDAFQRTVQAAIDPAFVN